MKIKIYYLPIFFLMIAGLSACQDEDLKKEDTPQDSFTLQIKPAYELGYEISGQPTSRSIGSNLYCYSWPLGNDSTSRLISEGFPKPEERINNGGYYQYELPRHDQSLFFSNLLSTTAYEGLEMEFSSTHSDESYQTAQFTFTADKGYCHTEIIYGYIGTITEADAVSHHYFVNDSVKLRRPQAKMQILLRLTDSDGQVISDPETYITRMWIETEYRPFFQKASVNFKYNEQGKNLYRIDEPAYENQVDFHQEITMTEMNKVISNGETLTEIVAPCYVFPNSFSPRFTFTFQMKNGEGKTVSIYTADSWQAGKEYKLTLDVALTQLQ